MAVKLGSRSCPGTHPTRETSTEPKRVVPLRASNGVRVYDVLHDTSQGTPQTSQAITQPARAAPFPSPEGGYATDGRHAVNVCGR
jgi:hypothetical protein